MSTGGRRTHAGPRRGSGGDRRVSSSRLQTHLYDGVLAAVDMAGTEGQRSVLVLSDGGDTSDTELDDVTKAVTDAEVLLDVVALEQTGARQGRAARSSPTPREGRVIDADSRRPARGLHRGGRRRWPGRCWSPRELPESVTGDEASVSVTLPTDDTTLAADAFAAVRADARATAPSDAAPPPPPRSRD